MRGKVVQVARALAACLLLVTGAGVGAALAILLMLAKMDKIPPFGRFPALRLVCCLQIWLYFAFLGRFQRVLRLLCGFVLFGCFAWLVVFLCA